MKALVTGATGFLGSNLVHELHAQGWEVRASGMYGSETRYLDALPVEVELADITQPADCARIVAGCDVVFHVAGDTSFWRRHYARQRRINVAGTAHIAQACIDAGVRRLVHTSTADLLGYHPDASPVDERGGSAHFEGLGYNYGETKRAAEEHLRGLDPEALEVVYVYPGFMIGPFDHTLQIGRVFFDLARGAVPAAPPGASSFCHVREVARAHVAAATRGRAGEGYLCAGMPHSNLSYAELFRRMAQAIQARPPRLTAPRSLFVAYGQLCELLAAVTGRPPEMNPGQARYMSLPQAADSSKAIRELGYTVPPVEQCIADALTWYRAQGYEI